MKLGDIADVFSGHPFRGAVAHAENGNGAVIQMKDVGRHSDIDWESLVLTEIKGRKEPNWLKSGDAVFLSRGVHYFSTYIETVESKTVCSPHFFVVRVHDERFLPGFISWQLNQSAAQSYFSENAVGSGQQNVPIGVLKNIELILLPIEQQLKIVELQAGAIGERRLYFDLIANREKQLDTLAEQVLRNKAEDEMPNE